MRLHEAAPKLIIQERLGDKVKVSLYWPVPELTRAELALGRLHEVSVTSEMCLFSRICPDGWCDISAGLRRRDAAVVAEDEGASPGTIMVPSLVELRMLRVPWVARKLSIAFCCDVSPGCATLLALTSFAVGTRFRHMLRLLKGMSWSPSLRIQSAILEGFL